MDLFNLIKIIFALRMAAKIKVKRNFSEFLSDKIVQASTESTLLRFIECLAKLLDADMGELHTETAMGFIVLQKDSGEKYLSWLRTYPKIAAMLACLPKYDDIRLACEQIAVDDVEINKGIALPQGEFDIPIAFVTLAPLSHGSDTKAGNATIFRRMQVMSNTGNMLELPFYAGNAIRGQMRDLLADHLLFSLGITISRDKPAVALWFFHALYAGGALAEDSKATKAINEAMGKDGAIKADGIYQFRDMLPGLSLLGCALGNRILPGKINVGDFRPECKEWGSGIIDNAQLFEWLYLTRREDHEGHADGENSAMIANTECIKAGVQFHGGIDMSKHISELEKSALGMGLFLSKERGYLGADNRRGFGKAEMTITNIPDKALYEKHLADNKEKIISYFNELGILQNRK